MAYEKRQVTLTGYALKPIHNFKDKRKKSRRARQITRTPPLSANLTAGPPSTRSDTKCKGERDAKKCKGEIRRNAKKGIAIASQFPGP